MRIVFMGTPEFAVPSLRKLAERHEVALVVTRPDAIRGRGRKLMPSAVKVAALELGLPVLEASRADEDMQSRVAAVQPDVICVAAYGALLPEAILLSAPYGCINVHASLLPHGRGAAPIQRAVLEGDETAGVSIMRLVQAMDAGPYCRQASVAIDDKTCDRLMAELAELGACELLAAIDDMASGQVQWVEQDESLATYAAKVTKDEMRLDPQDGAVLNQRRVKASTDAAPARVKVAGRGIRVMDACTSTEDVAQSAVRVEGHRVLLGCSEGTLELLRVKPDGKREMDVSAWSAGLRKDASAWERA